jgi:hypothetical protein
MDLLDTADYTGGALELFSAQEYEWISEKLEGTHFKQTFVIMILHNLHWKPYYTRIKSQRK